MRIAYLEDEQAHAALVRSWLVEAGHTCRIFPRAESFMRELAKQSYDLLLLDWELPDGSGIDVVEWVREHTDWHIPVLFITNRDSEGDIVQALRHGADDYMVKPVSRAVTIARIDALSRRFDEPLQRDEPVELSGYRIDRNRCVISRDDEPIDLTDKEFQLALTLFTNLGRLLSRDYLLDAVWSVGPDLSTRTVDTHISRVRRKLALAPEHGWRLKAVYNHGYRLERITDDLSMS